MKQATRTLNIFFGLALVISLAFGAISPARASAAPIVVTPASADWIFNNDNGTTGDWTTGIVSGPATPPLGTGSVHITLASSAAGINFGSQKYAGTLLSSITSLSYSTYTNLSPAAMTFQINYDPDLTVGGVRPWFGRLTFEPYMNNTVTNGVWQNWDMLNGGNGLWWASGNANSPVDNICGQGSPCTLSFILATWPNIGVRNDALTFIGFKAGSNWNGFDGAIDNLSVTIGATTDTYDFEPVSTVYVDDSWAGTAIGTDPDGAGPATNFGADSFETIQKGLDAVAPNGTVHVADGVYPEEIAINKPVSLLGPNDSINPNTGTRGAEAVIQPVTIGTDPYGVCTVVAMVNTGNVTFKGFTVDGNNPALTSGVLVNGVDVDACEGVAGWNGMANTVFENNIVQNTTYTGVDFDNYNVRNATAGNYIRYNHLHNIGNSTIGFGIGVLVYDNFYADITDNVFTAVRTGIQTGNYNEANPGTTGRISNNEIHSWRLGIFHNLWYQNASNFPVTNNTISVIDNAGATRWAGIAFTSFSVPTTITGNIINATPVSQQTTGYMVWNDLAAGGLTLSGGSVTGANYGVWVNNYVGYNSNGGPTDITVDGVAISGASLAGVYVQDDPLNTNGATVHAKIINTPISASGTGVKIEGSDASAEGSCNQIAGNTSGVNNTTTALLSFEKNWWGSPSGPSGSGLGTGDSVSANVDYTPWNTDTTCANFAPPFSTTTTITSDTPDPSMVGAAVTVNFTVATNPSGGLTPTGTVDLKDGSTVVCSAVALTNGSGSCSVNFATLGSHVLTAVFTGSSADFLTSTSATESHLVVPATFTVQGNAGIGGAVISYSDGGPQTVTALPDGSYSLTVSNNFAGTITPKKTGYVFTPSSISYASNPVTHDLTAQDFTAVATATFADVPVSHWAWINIETLYANGITNGCGINPLIYCPDNPVTRAQMAVFLIRGIKGLSFTPPAATGTTFTDVPANAFAAAYIEELARDGYTNGCGVKLYCPNNPVTRAQMAIFLLRAKYGSSFVPANPATGTVFLDVPANAFAAAYIEQLYSEGITDGCGGNKYCPDGSVTRAQMAVFLVRVFNLK